MVEELIEKKINYLKSLKTKDVRVLAKLEELQWVLQIIEFKESLKKEKKIPEKIPEEIIVGKKQPTHRIKKIEKKINEIISYLDYLKSKGE